MDRRVFIRQTAVAALGGLVAFDLSNALAKSEMAFAGKGEISPRAITMWDFSWLERRWPGAGYEDWDQVLDELSERGYNAIRIDAYPHLIAENPMKKWLLKEVWNQQDWGSPDMNEVQVQPNLNLFLSKCKERDIKVGLSSWYRLDVDEVCLKLDTPEKLAACWLTTLRSIEEDGLLDTILYVDLCNEWPGDSWAPFFAKTYPNVGWGNWYKEESLRWMKTSLEKMRQVYPDMPFLYSFDHGDVKKYEEVDCSFLDLYEHHIWMAQQNGGEFYKLVGYGYNRFLPDDYKNVVKNAERVYRERPGYWQKLLTDKIELMASVARKNRRPLVTTECWGLVDYKDWPLLKWDWVKDLCELGTITAARTGLCVVMAGLGAAERMGEGIQPVDAAGHKVLIVAHERLCAVVDAADSRDDPDLVADGSAAVLAAVAHEGVRRGGGQRVHIGVIAVLDLTGEVRVDVVGVHPGAGHGVRRGVADGKAVFDDVFAAFDGRNGHLVALGDVLNGGDGGVIDGDCRAFGDGMQGDDDVVLGVDLNGDRHKMSP